jgi:hypothetical protein
MGSFRDPCGVVYSENGVLYRKVDFCYKENYEFFHTSGLFDKLVSSGLLVPHIEIKDGKYPVYKIIKPEVVPFISYPYEWCFSQLKEAALLTLKVQKIALEYGMCLKDASAYNVQFVKNRPLFIDTLSFEMLDSDKPWVAYRQFCQHFVIPLALMANTDVRLNQLLKIYIDGIPLDLGIALLPSFSRFKPGLFLHVYLHAQAQGRFTKKNINQKAKSHKFSSISFYALIDNLESLIKSLKHKPRATGWSDYYSDNVSYDPVSLEHKKEIVSGFLDRIRPKNAWDLGANIGIFSRIAGNKGILTISFDLDHACVEKSYRMALRDNEVNILPLVLDITNPSPGIGWENNERASLIERGPVDLVMAFALIHHLAISNNVPFYKIVHFLSYLCHYLIIEFIPKEDKMVKTLLAGRSDIFENYTLGCFEREFSKFFTIRQSFKIKNSQRLLYLMEIKNDS